MSVRFGPFIKVTKPFHISIVRCRSGKDILNVLKFFLSTFHNPGFPEFKQSNLDFKSTFGNMIGYAFQYSVNTTGISLRYLQYEYDD